MADGVGYCEQAKTTHKGFCLSMLEKLIKYFPGGSHKVMKITTRDPVHIPLMAMG